MNKPWKQKWNHGTSYSYSYHSNIYFSCGIYGLWNSYQCLIKYFMSCLLCRIELEMTIVIFCEITWVHVFIVLEVHLSQCGCNSILYAKVPVNYILVYSCIVTVTQRYMSHELDILIKLLLEQLYTSIRPIKTYWYTIKI